VITRFAMPVFWLLVPERGCGARRPRRGSRGVGAGCKFGDNITGRV